MMKREQDAAAVHSISEELRERSTTPVGDQTVLKGAGSAGVLEETHSDSHVSDQGSAGQEPASRTRLGAAHGDGSHADGSHAGKSHAGSHDIGLQELETAPDGEGSRSVPGGQLWSLQHHAVIAQATGMLIASHQMSAQQAEVPLAQEAFRQGLGVLEVARALVVDPASAHEVPLAVCSLCRATGVMRVFGDTGQVRVWVCPQGHGVIRRA